MSDQDRQLDFAVLGASLSAFVVAHGLRRRGCRVALLHSVFDNGALEGVLEVPSSPINAEPLSGLQFAQVAQAALIAVGVATPGTGTGVRLPPSQVGPVALDTLTGETIEASKLIYSPVGLESGLPWLPEVSKLYGKGVSMDAWSDGKFFKERRVGIVGGGRRAGEQALIALRAGATPIILSPNERFEPSGLGRLLSQAGVEVREGVEVVDLKTDQAGHLREVTLERPGEGRSSMPLAALLLAQGLVCGWTVFDGSFHEVIHPSLVKSGIAAGLTYWDYEGQVRHALRLIEQLG